MLKPRHILMILTSNARMGADGEPTGLWFEELATPYYTFVDAGAAVTLGSISGGPAPIDPRSVKMKGENETSVERFLVDASAFATENTTARGMPLVVYAFALSAFALGFTEFVTIGLVPAISASLHVEVEAISGAVAAFAIGATIGAPVLTGVDPV